MVSVICLLIKSLSPVSLRYRAHLALGDDRVPLEINLDTIVDAYLLDLLGEIKLKASQVLLSEGILLDELAILLRYYFIQDLLGSVCLISWLSYVVEAVLAEELLDEHLLEVVLVPLFVYIHSAQLITPLLAHSKLEETSDSRDAGSCAL